ncbi:hypothetical protein [Streptomyces chrestomyceticus]|uniref:hypothetical protein n=1 Tax=Streptomyces chrestomyceticus TaxID=68185 RepID=UPI0033FE74CF
MQKAVALDTAVYRAGGDPDKQYVNVHLTIGAPRDPLLDLAPEQREALLIGALEGMSAALPEKYDVTGALTYQERVPVTFEDDTEGEPEQPVGE